MPSVLITGGNKGLGAGFVANYLCRDDHIVIATVRNPLAEDAKALKSLPKGLKSDLIIVTLENKSDKDAADVVQTLQSKGVDHLDVVIANAGIFPTAAFHNVSEMKVQDLIHHVDVNAGGPIRLFQAVLPLLKKAKQPRFAAISTFMATITDADQVPFTTAAYGASKAALNYLVRRSHVENEDIIALALHPGAVKTDEGNKACRFFGLPEAFVTVEDAVKGSVGKIDSATRAAGSGQFLAFDSASPLHW